MWFLEDGKGPGGGRVGKLEGVKGGGREERK